MELPRDIPKPQPYPQSLTDIDQDFKVKSNRDLESRAATIRLSTVPIINQQQGKVRVARQVSSKSPISVKKFEKVVNVPVDVPVDVQGLKSLAPNIRVSQAPTYEYRPPQAAKYFLWDSTCIGTQSKLVPKSLIPIEIKISESAQKALSIELMKRELLSHAESLSNSFVCGYFVGSMCVDRVVSIDRFERDRPSGDIVVQILDTNNPLYETEQYGYCLTMFKESRESNPTDQLAVPFPISIHVSFKDNEIMKMVKRVLVPNYEIDVIPIHPLRIVYTELSQSLSSGNHKAEFGFLSIDQARQLYFLSPTDPRIFSIPLIGVWCNQLEMNDHRLHSLIVRYITNTKIFKLDTGKNQLLVSRFTKENPPRPECYQVNFNYVGDFSFAIYECDGATGNEFVDVHVQSDLTFCKAWNALFEQKLALPVETVVESNDIDFTQEEPEMLESEGEKEEDRVVLEKVVEDVPVSVKPQEKMDVQPEPVMSSVPTGVSFMPAGGTGGMPIPTGMPGDPMTFMYISMLQQQISSLQSQLLTTKFNFRQPEPIQKKETRTIGTNTVLQTVSVSVNTDPMECLKVDVGVNTVDEDVTPRASPRLEPIQVPESESRFESLQTEPFPIPSDTGTNFKALYDFEDPCKPPSLAEDSDISFAQQVIPQLVSNCEDSFVYHEIEPESMGPNLFKSEERFRESRLDFEERMVKEMKKNETMDFSTRNSIDLEDPSTFQDLSLSFDTINYLKKYGL